MGEVHRDFRERLLEAEAMTPALRARYQTEVKTMLQRKLTAPMKWVYALVGVLALGLFVRFGSLAVTAAGLPWPIRIAWGVGALGSLAWVGLTILVLSRGTIDLRVHPRAFVGIIWAVLVVLMTMTLILAGQNPDSPRSTFMVVCALVFFIMGAVFLIVQRVEQTELKTREKLLEIELRLADLSDRTTKGDGE